MSLTGTAKETISIVERGSYQSRSGNTVTLRAEIDRAIDGTQLYTPESFANMQALKIGNAGPKFEVTGETTAQAGRRLVQVEKEERVVALNFASAKNVGGGFLKGSKAQEEDLARCSALYNCLLTQRQYYDANRSFDSLLYTDHLIYSPDVPFFRDDSLKLLDEPFLLSIITSPAPNAGEVQRQEPASVSKIRETLDRRAAQILLVASAQKHKSLILGAWGCGVFRNDVAEVADVFAKHLESPQFSKAFERIVFAVYDRSENQEKIRAFADRFAQKNQ